MFKKVTHLVTDFVSLKVSLKVTVFYNRYPPIKNTPRKYKYLPEVLVFCREVFTSLLSVLHQPIY